MPTPAVAAGVSFATGAGLAVVIPVAAARGGFRAPAVAAGALLLAGVVVAAASAGAGGALLACLPLAGFAVLLGGAVRALLAARCPPGAAAGLAALLGCGLLVLPFVGDSLVEPGGPGRASPAAIATLVGGSPLCASVGGGLGIDLLKSPRAYGASGGGLSRIGPYYAYSYPAPGRSAAGLAAAGLLLAAASAGLARRRSAP